MNRTKSLNKRVKNITEVYDILKRLSLQVAALRSQSGGGGSQNLQSVTTVGNETTEDIIVRFSATKYAKISPDGIQFYDGGVLVTDLNSYSFFSSPISVYGGFEYTMDPYIGIQIKSETNIAILTDAGINFNGTLYSFPTGVDSQIATLADLADLEIPGATLHVTTTAGDVTTNTIKVHNTLVGGRGTDIGAGTITLDSTNTNPSKMTFIAGGSDATTYIHIITEALSNIFIQGNASAGAGSIFLNTPNKTGTGVYTIAVDEDLPTVAGDYANDAAAAAGGILVGGMYHTAGTVKIRLT